MQLCSVADASLPYSNTPLLHLRARRTEPHALQPSGETMTDNRPNILWMFSDQHSANAMSCYGDPNVETPILDRLADEGLRFTNAYSNAPLCSPFRACLYRGQ